MKAHCRPLQWAFYIRQFPITQQKKAPTEHNALVYCNLSSIESSYGAGFTLPNMIDNHIYVLFFVRVNAIKKAKVVQPNRKNQYLCSL